ncbi:tyrosine-type recombinase/integrase [Sorangium sp. So ce260]|uniref:tyrosine-type recombinase/integrase n=1 Tax=Sorangium sp. So ce260 TaxID=3133291 RepID=UPI003F5F1EC9
MLSELAGRLLAAGQIVLGLPLLEQAAAREGNALRDVRLAIDQLCKGEARARATGETTFAEFAERVLSGKLAEQYPDHVKAIRSADDYRSRLAHVLDVLGPVPLVRLTIDHADRAMSLLPGHLEPSTRRNVAMVVHRILSLAVYPARLIGSNPLPRGWVPKADHDKAKGYLYPDEDRRLMLSQEIPLCFRIYYGFLIREGMRADEAGQLEWSDVDLDRGAVVLDENKTDDPRAWALSPDVVRALRKWREICPDQVRVFVGKWGNPLPGNNGAERFRFHLRRAGIARPELFETTEARLNIRLHDTRATFITIKLANDRTETWISDRTGHKSSGQIHHYKRAARKVAELRLGDFAPLDEAIPELAGRGRAEGAPAPAGPATRAASAEAAIAPAQTVQAPARGDLPARASAAAEAPEEGRLGPRWANPQARRVEPQSEPMEIIDLIPDRSSVPGKSLGDGAGAQERIKDNSTISRALRDTGDWDPLRCAPTRAQPAAVMELQRSITAGRGSGAPVSACTERRRGEVMAKRRSSRVAEDSRMRDPTAPSKGDAIQRITHTFHRRLVPCSRVRGAGDDALTGTATARRRSARRCGSRRARPTPRPPCRTRWAPSRT